MKKLLKLPKMLFYMLRGLWLYLTTKEVGGIYCDIKFFKTINDAKKYGEWMYRPEVTRLNYKSKKTKTMTWRTDW